VSRPSASRSCPRIGLHHRRDVLWRGRRRSALKLDSAPARDVPDGQLADQLRLIEAVALAVGREVGQTLKLKSSIGALPGLALDCLDCSPCRRLRCGHASGGQRLHGDRQTIRERDLVALRALPKIDQDSSFVNQVHRQGGRALHRGPGVVGARLLRFLIQEKAPAWTASAVRGILSCIGRPATHVDEVSAPHGESLGLVRAPSAGRAHRAGLCGLLAQGGRGRLKRTALQADHLPKPEPVEIGPKAGRKS
jgi:hypothetical protein